MHAFKWAFSLNQIYLIYFMNVKDLCVSILLCMRESKCNRYYVSGWSKNVLSGSEHGNGSTSMFVQKIFLFNLE